MKKISLLFVVIVLFAFNINAQTTVSDADGNQYNTVTIGTQVWTKENLKTTKYSDGTSIDLVTENSAWSDLFTGAYCQYPSSGDDYGYLYNFYAVDNSKNLCPTDWHVATYDDWNALVSYLGGPSDAASKLKEIGTAHWGEPNTDATNESGFTAFGGGYRNPNGVFYNILDDGYFWHGTETGEDYAWYSVMDPSSGYLNITDNDKKDGMSVRCIRDISAGIEESHNQSFEIYPNPTQDFIQIENLSDCKSIEIFNVTGQLVVSQTITNESNFKIDISELNSGNYLVKLIDSNNNVFSSDFIKN
jgi:uncharacterized protein (TIGR02145 family)